METIKNDIVAVIGSMRFHDKINEVGRDLYLSGNSTMIPFKCTVNGIPDEIMHNMINATKRSIDASDIVMVVNANNSEEESYIGHGVMSECIHAAMVHKKISYVSVNFHPKKIFLIPVVANVEDISRLVSMLSYQDINVLLSTTALLQYIDMIDDDCSLTSHLLKGSEFTDYNLIDSADEVIFVVDKMKIPDPITKLVKYCRTNKPVIEVNL